MRTGEYFENQNKTGVFLARLEGCTSERDKEPAMREALSPNEVSGARIASSALRKRFLKVNVILHTRFAKCEFEFFRARISFLSLFF
ncbi:hypothetical protein CDAR_211071 [Caerostris darwini]|uniref:Uncharacterized protein n=1 Tax=Caerostris darwini TaxID=1538125 RepID=A0AAV4QRF1_9ARAC|nr:hypothetical protein CDAR_211071 [Caerostris darwini]